MIIVTEERPYTVMAIDGNDPLSLSKDELLKHLGYAVAMCRTSVNSHAKESARADKAEAKAAVLLGCM